MQSIDASSFLQKFLFPMSASMSPMFLFFVVSSLLTHPFLLVAQPPKPNSHLTVVGAVYCDTCFENTFSRKSYFLPGVEVHVQCKFKANSPKTTEQITFAVNRTTNRYGVYQLDIPSLEGVDCVEGAAIQSFCESSLIQSNTSSSTCNIPSMKATINQITVKSKQANLCIYSLSALSCRPPERNASLCEKTLSEDMKIPSDFNSSKTFFPFFPPYVFPWPPLPQLPPLPKLPPLPQLPPFPYLPFPFPFTSPPLPQLPPFPFLPFPPPPSTVPRPPSLPFPFPPSPPLPQLPPLPPLPPFPFFPFPPPPSTIPSPPPSLPFPFPPLPRFPPNVPLPPSPPFNWGDPRTWPRPNFPFLSPPPPPPHAFNLLDPRTWIPFAPPTPPNSP